MREVKDEKELAALPMWVVVRTASEQVRERGMDGRWFAMGVSWPDHQVRWKEEDFPAKVLWTYAEEIGPPYKDIYPYGGQGFGGGTTVVTQT